MIESAMWTISEKILSPLLRGVMTCAILAVLAGEGLGAIDVIYPQPRTWTDRSDHLVFRLNGLEYTGVRVTINGVDSDIFPIGTPDYRRAFQDFVILKPLWDPGKNTLLIEAFRESTVSDSVTAEIHYVPRRGNEPPPADTPRSIMHTPSREVACVACHLMNPTVEQVNRTTGKKNPCYGCHRSITTPSHVHGPVGTFSCAWCHALGGDPKYSTPKRDATLCGECHVETMKRVRGWKLRHGPVDVGMCEICHDPHGSEEPYLMRRPVNELCLSCHEDVAKGIHVVRTTRNESHPLSGKPDMNPNRQGLDIACISCHNPHGGDVRYYFQNNEEDRMALCQFCHRK